MVIILSVVAALGLALGAAWVMGSPRQQPDRAAEACWSMLAEMLNLDYDPGGLLKGPYMSGKINGMTVTLDTFHQMRDGRKSLMTRFILQNESLPEGLDRKSKAKPSDDAVKRIIAQTVRRYVSELIKKIGATVAAGKVRWVRDSSVWHPDATAQTIKRIVSICEFLCVDDSDQAAKLLIGYQDESMPEPQRKQMKTLLFERFPGTPAVDLILEPKLFIGGIVAGHHKEFHAHIPADQIKFPLMLQTTSSIGPKQRFLDVLGILVLPVSISIRPLDFTKNRSIGNSISSFFNRHGNVDDL